VPRISRPWASPPQLRPWARTSKKPSSARERPPPRGLFLLPTAALDGPRRYRRRPRSSPMTLPDPTGDAVRFSALRSSAEISVGAANPHRGNSRAKGLRRQGCAYFRRSCHEIPRGRIRRFESYMPSHAVVSNRRSAKEKLRPEGSARRAILGPTHVQAARGRPCRLCWAAAPSRSVRSTPRQNCWSDLPPQLPARLHSASCCKRRIWRFVAPHCGVL